MGVSSGPSIFLLAVAAVALLTGLWLIWRGWRGRRVGDAPFCTKCGYSLVGRSSDRCPECGADASIPAGVVYGQRVWNRRSAAIGAFVAIVALLFCVGVGSQSVRNFDWYTLKPTGYLLADLDSSIPANRDRAWRELARRQRNGTSLSTRHHDRLAEIALAEQGGKSALPLSGELISWLGREVLGGRLNDAQKQRFYEQSTRLTLTVRPKVIEGDEAPYRVSHEGRGPADSAGVPWWSRIEDVSVSVDGGPPRALGGSGANSGLGGGGSTGSMVAVKGLGPHELRVVMRVEAWTGPDFADTASPRNTLQSRRDVALAGTLEVVPDAPEHRAQRVQPDPVTEGRLRAAIKPESFEFRPALHPSLSGSLKLQSIPVDVAFAVIARVSGKEYPLGSINLVAGGATNYHIRGNYDGPTDVTTFNLILRPDETVARRTVDITRMWDAALEFKDVPIKMAGK